jgi:uncharacterized repeat protein (TIGR01451 family)
MEHPMLRRVIAGLIFGLALTLSAVGPADAQSGPLCDHFGAGSAGLDGWGPCPGAPNIVVDTSNVSSIGGLTDYYLHLRDLSGASAACTRDEQFTGDWNAKMGGCGQFCFDFKVFVSGTPPGPITPSFTIWSGTAKATFVANFTVTSADPWRQHICAPINLIQPGQNPPSGASGAWHTTGNWNAIIQAVTMVQLPIDWTSDPSEEAGYDNICMTPGGCGVALKVCKVAGPGILVGTPFTFTVGSSTISVPAGSAPAGTCVDGPSVIEGTNVTVTETIPAGDAVSSVTVAPPSLLVSTNLATGTANVTIGSGVTEVTYTDVCSSPGGCDGHQTGGTGCLQDTKAEVKCNPDGTYTLTLSGSGFTGTEITLTSQTAGVTVSPPQQAWAATTSWTLVGATPGQTVTLSANATQVGGGSQPGTDSCCSGEIKITMPDCPKPSPIDVKIVKGEVPTLIGQPPGTHWFDLTVTNAGAAFSYPAGAITVTDNVPLGMTVTSATGTGWVCTPSTVVGPNPLTCTYTPGGMLAASGMLPPILVKTTTSGPGPLENCAIVGLSPSSGLLDSDPSNNKSCVRVTTPTPKVDLQIKKTGETRPGPAGNAYAFHLTVTNVGSPFNGNSVVTVTDVVPAGMTFTSATGLPDWTCNAPPAIQAGGTLTCTYVGTGPTTTGQVFSTINISASATGNGPFENCAAVGVTAASGLQDSNPANNSDCATVGKPSICPPPLVPGPVAGQCVCPAGTTLVGRECVRLPECRPPLVPNAAGNACVCPAGTVRRGQECVRPPPPPVCPPPMVPGAVAGQCVCPSGTVQKGRECVREIACRPPMIPNAAGTACACPQGTVAEGNNCVRRESPRPSFTLPEGGPRERPGPSFGLPESGPRATPGEQQNVPREQQPGPAGRGSPTR